MKCKKQERVLQADYRKSCRQELAGRLPKSCRQTSGHPSGTYGNVSATSRKKRNVGNRRIFHMKNDEII